MHSPEFRVTQVSFVPDRLGRDGHALLAAWPTLPAVARAVAEAGVQVTVVVAAHADETFSEDGVRYHFAAARRGRVRPRTALAPTVAAVVASRPDVVHVHGFTSSHAVRPLLRALPATPIIVQDHGGGVPRLARLTNWRSNASWAGAVFTAKEQAEHLRRAGMLGPGVRVFEAVEMSSHFAPGDAAAARHATGMFGNPCMLWTGRLDENKDPLTVLAAFEEFAAHAPEARLWCCYGDAPLLPSVTRRIAASPLLSERVTLVGTRPHAEMELRFRAADFLVQASHREGSGYSVIEALACGTTPLVSDIPSFRRMVGDAGSLTPVGDARALAAAMRTWHARNQGERREAARAQFERRLSFTAMSADLLAAYRGVAQ
jgi:glycosyltransferase involved in cell wall biosynthesis